MGRSLGFAVAAVVLVAVAHGRLEAQAPAGGRTHVAVAGHVLQAMQGLAVDVYAEGLRDARFMTLGPDGAPYLSIPSRGQVVRLPDVNGDGRADTVITVVQGLNRPHGLAFRGDTLYVAETNRVVRFLPGSTTPQVVVPSLPSGGADRGGGRWMSS